MEIYGIQWDILVLYTQIYTQVVKKYCIKIITTLVFYVIIGINKINFILTVVL